MSRRHLEIRWDGQVALLSDLNSTNGTTVNNAPVQEWQLADGDVIRLGHSRSSSAFTEDRAGRSRGEKLQLHPHADRLSKYRDVAEAWPSATRHDGADATAGCRRDGTATVTERTSDAGLVLQLTRVGFLLLLWLFIWSVLRILRTDIYAPTGAGHGATGPGAARLAAAQPGPPPRRARQLVVTEGALAGTRITLGTSARADRPGRRLDAGAHRRLRLDAARPGSPTRFGMVCRGPRIDQRHIP